MKITLDLLDELNEEYGQEQRIAAFRSQCVIFLYLLTSVVM
jgi:hypothetical protein